MASSSRFGIEMTILDNSQEALSKLEEALKAGLTECGLLAERTAKQRCPVAQPWNWKYPKKGYIGGTLRNSIATAVDGTVPKTDGKRDYENPNKDKRITGHYEQQTPREPQDGKKALYVGTNVYYAPYVEMGTSKMKKRPFIEPALMENRDEFVRILKGHLEGTAGFINE